MPFESTTCQCGSGVCGGTKSSESVSVLLPFAVVCVTKPLFAFAPWNGPLLWLSWAKLLVAAMTSAVKEASMVLYIIRFGLVSFAEWVSHCRDSPDSSRPLPNPYTLAGWIGYPVGSARENKRESQCQRRQLQRS